MNSGGYQDCVYLSLSGSAGYLSVVEAQTCDKQQKNSTNSSQLSKKLLQDTSGLRGVYGGGVVVVHVVEVDVDGERGGAVCWYE